MNKTFRVFHIVLSIIGVPIFAKLKWDSKLRLGHQVFNFIIGFLQIVFTTGFVCNSFSDTLDLIEGACIWTTGVIMFISLSICLLFRQKFKGFLNEMVFKDTILEMPLIKYALKSDRDGANKVKALKDLVIKSQENLLKYTRIILKVYVASVTLCVTLYICDTIYEMYVTEDETLRLLAFDMWFPWSLKNFKIYLATFIFHVYAGYLCASAYPGLQCTIILLIGQVIRQLKIIAFILVHLDSLSKELAQNDVYKWQDYCTNILCQCIDQYEKIKRFSNRLNVICRPFYLVLILDAIMLVCVCSVKIAISTKVSLDAMKYYVHEISFILMVLMFCILGQRVQNECDNVEKAVTESWYAFNKNHKLMVRMFSMALNRGMPIYIFGSITLSLPTFTWFIKTGMSFFTLVMSVLED